MDYSIYIDYLKEAGLYQAFEKNCRGVTWKILNPEMIIHASPAFIYEHCSAPLNAITDELLGTKLRIRPAIGFNFDMIAYFKWMLVFLQHQLKNDSGKEEQEIIKYKGKYKELLQEKEETNRAVFQKQESKIIGYLSQYGLKGAPELLPDETISLNREFWKLSQWNKEDWDRRPKYTDLISFRPLIINAKYRTELYEISSNEKKQENLKEKKIPVFKVGFKEVGNQFKGGIQGGVNNIQKMFESKNNGYLKLEENLRKRMKSYELQEIMEYIEFINVLITNCSQKYFL